MKARTICLTMAALLGACQARDFNVTLWRGETTTARLHDYVGVGECPKGIAIKTGVARRTDYLVGCMGTQYAAAADCVTWGVKEPGPRIISVTAAPEVCPGVYRCGDVVVKVLDRVLPPVSEWKYNLDLWQHPWAVARWFDVEPFSPAHYARMRPLWQTLAAAGQKPLTVTITDLPWNHQCYDAYHSMVRHIRHADGSWTFDYRVFDDYVAFGRSCGLGRNKIHCYTMCPWDYEVYWEDDSGARKSAQAVPGSDFFREYWGPFLADFAVHLRTKGWFDSTYICLDERTREDVEKVCSFIREKAPGLKTSLAANRRPSEFAGIKIDDYCSALRLMTDDYLAEAAGRRARGLCTTCYVCCGPERPNTFMTSAPEEAFWLGAFPGVIGLDGFLRWAWNSWPMDPYRNAAYSGLGGGWPPGDTFLVYPHGEPSLRFLELANGIVAAEKLRILKEGGELPGKTLKKLKELFDFRQAQKGCDWRAARKAVQEVVNDDARTGRHSVKFKGEQLLVDGTPFLVRGGEIHPQRIPREYWEHRILMMKAMGLNTVSCYFFWNDFERPDGTFDFKTGCRDVAAFLALCQRQGMKVLFRPGPYCCGEWDLGGLPSRLFAGKNYLIRTTKNPEYLKECERYLTAICEVARPYLWQNGGPIILTQVENEYGSWRAKDRTPELIVWTKELLKRLGFGPFYMADGVGDYFYRNLPYPDPEIAVGMDPGMNEADWETARKINPGVPLLSAETYPGWLRHWGEANWTPADLTKEVDWFVKRKKSFCIFVVHGGTSFGFTTGANASEKEGGFEPDLTSYDYGAPISEQGLATRDYHRYRAILAQEVGGVERLPKVPDPIPAMDIPEMTPTFFAPLTANCGKPFATESCVHFESFGQNQGMAIYETELAAGDAAELVFERLADYAKVLVNGSLVATIDRRLRQQSCKIPRREGSVRLTLLVEAMGHINFGYRMEDDRKGISGKVTLGGAEVKGWTVTPKPLTPETVVGATGVPLVPGVPGGHFRCRFELQKTADTFIDMSKWSKGTVFVNGRNLGRYWKIGPQYSLYCPASWLKLGQNQIDVFDMDSDQPRPLRGVKANVVIDSKTKTKNANNVW